MNHNIQAVLVAHSRAWDEILEWVEALPEPVRLEGGQVIRRWEAALGAAPTEQQARDWVVAHGGQSDWLPWISYCLPDELDVATQLKLARFLL